MIHEYENNVTHLPWLPDNEITRALELQDEARRELAVEQQRSQEMLGGLFMAASIVLTVGAFAWAMWL